MIDSNTYNFYTLWRVILPYACQQRHLFPAGLTPSGPEIRDGDLPLPVEEAAGLAVQVGKDGGKQRGGTAVPLQDHRRQECAGRGRGGSHSRIR
jgi:hypothetical protein